MSSLNSLLLPVSKAESLVPASKDASTRRSFPDEFDKSSFQSRWQSLLNQKIPDHQTQELFNEISQHVQSLELRIRNQEKENEKLSHMNEFYQISSKRKEDMIEEQRKTIIDLRDKIVKLENQQKTALKSSATTHRPVEKQQSQSNLKKGENNQNSNNVQVSRPSQSDSQKKTQLKQKKDPEDDSHVQNFNIIRSEPISHAEAKKIFQQYDYFEKLKKMVRVEDEFIDTLQRSDNRKLQTFHEQLRKIISDFEQFFHLIIRLQNVNNGSYKIVQQLVLNDALELIVDETCACLQCDRASVFIVDSQKHELWSKVAKGTSKVLRIPMNKGLAGQVCTSREPLNIRNAYADERFNQEIDKKLGYTTKTILCMPILDENRECLGVIQCINKLTSDFFTPEDEGLLQVLSNFARLVLQKSINLDDSRMQDNKLRHVIQTALLLPENMKLQELLQLAEKRLKDLMYVDESRIVVNDQKGKLFYFDSNGEKVEVDLGVGISGRTVKEKEMDVVDNCLNNQSYDRTIDMDTQMPVIFVPITVHNSDKVFGVIQVVYLRAMSNLYREKRHKVMSFDKDILMFFVQFLGFNLQRLLQ